MTTTETEQPITETPPDSGIRERLGVKPPTGVEWMNLMMFADSGVGKTHLVGTADDHPDMFPLLILDCEGGTVTLKKRPNVDVKQVRTIPDLQKYHKDLFMHNEGWYKTVSIDSGSEIADVDMRMIMKETKKNAKNPDTVDIDVPSPREWGKMRSHMRTIVRGYRDLPMHFIFTSMLDERNEKGDDKGVKPTRFYPAISGRTRTEISGFMDLVGYYYQEDEDKRILQFQKTKRVPSVKSRFPELGKQIVNPTLPEMWEVIKNASIIIPEDVANKELLEANKDGN